MEEFPRDWMMGYPKSVGPASEKERAQTCAVRSFLTHAMTRLAASSISANVVSPLKLKRMAERSTSSGTPMARITGEGKSEPLEQAEPVEQATPSRSNFMSKTSAAQPGKETLIVPGMPLASGPLST